MPALPAAREYVVIASGIAGNTVSMAVARLVLFTSFWAVTTTRVGDETVGAVNRPFSRIMPEVAVQMTTVLLVLVVVAANCSLEPEVMVAEEGQTSRELIGGGMLRPVILWGEIAQPTEKYASINRSAVS